MANKIKGITIKIVDITDLYRNLKVITLYLGQRCLFKRT